MCVYIVLQSFQDVTANSFQAQTKATSDSTGLNLLNFMTIQRVARRKPLVSSVSAVYITCQHKPHILTVK